MNRLRDIQLSYQTARYPHPEGFIRLEAQMWKPSANSTQKAHLDRFEQDMIDFWGKEIEHIPCSEKGD